MFRTKWEYYVKTLNASPSIPDEIFLDHQGEKGWELIHATNHYFIFKRKVRWWR